MAIPSVFTPVELGKKYLVDGGVLDNFPVKVALDMGADIIIGVNRQTIKNLAEFRKILEKQPGVLALNIQRGDRTIYLVIR